MKTFGGALCLFPLHAWAYVEDNFHARGPSCPSPPLALPASACLRNCAFILSRRASVCATSTICAFALSEIFMCSQTVRNGDSIQYFQNGQLRAIAGVDGETPNGPFEVFYPNGQTWMRGAYENGFIKPGAMKIFMPDGSEAKPGRPAPALLH